MMTTADVSLDGVPYISTYLQRNGSKQCTESGVGVLEKGGGRDVEFEKIKV